MLVEQTIERILERLPSVRIGVLGDLFLDRYLELDASLTEPSIETGLDAYQVVRVRSVPGAAGTIINNLVALGVGAVIPMSIIGEDGEGFELRQALSRLPGVDTAAVFTDATRRTPTYTKPMQMETHGSPRELNRLDIKNRTPLGLVSERRILEALDTHWPTLNALLVLDQVSEAECGVVTTQVRHRLSVLGAASPDRFILADSRERIGEFRNVAIKPNRAECLRAVPGEEIDAAAPLLSRRCGRPVFCTVGETGIILTEADGRRTVVPGFAVSGPIDPVGAGDSTSAGIAAAVAAGASAPEAAHFGNLVASITIQQIGATGTATPEQVRQRWRDFRAEGTSLS